MALAYVLGAITITVILAGVAVVVLARIYHSGASNGGRRSPTLRAKATVLGKRTDEVTHHNAAFASITTKYYYVTFDLGNGDTMELSTDKHTYKDDNIGKSGTLVYKGSKFINFVKS